MRHAPTPTRPAGGGSRRAGWLAWSRVGTSVPEARAPRCYPAERRSELGQGGKRAGGARSQAIVMTSTTPVLR